MPRTKTVLSALALSACALLATATPSSAAVSGAGATTAAPAAAARSAGGGSFMVGASIPAGDLGPLPVQRLFRSDVGSAPSFVSVVSFTRWDDAAVRAFVRDAVPGTALAYLHEPEQEVAHGNVRPSDWADRAVALAQIVQQEGRVGEVHPATVLMRWTLAPESHRQGMLASLLTPAVLNAFRAADGVLGFDAYAGPRNNRTPQDMYGVAASWAAAAGLPWAILETGTRLNDPARWRDTFSYLESMPVPPRYFLAWNPPDLNGGVYAIQNQPEVASIWRSEMAAHFS